MTILESRLDNVIFRLGFARTRKEARQIVDHKHVTSKRQSVLTSLHTLVKAGDVIEIKEKQKEYSENERYRRGSWRKNRSGVVRRRCMRNYREL